MLPRQSIVLNKLAAKPSIPKEGYHVFTPESWDQILNEEEVEKFRLAERKSRMNEGKLVDGELRFDDIDEDEEGNEPDPDLVVGSKLPEDKLWPFPDKLLGKPIEEIDPNVKDKTFVVINTRFRTKYIYRFTATKSFFICTPWNPFRKFVILISTNQFFDYFIMLTILVNCIFLALNNDIPNSEYVFLAVYTLEMIIRMFSRGLVINSYTYLRDPYNFVDILIILLSYIMIIVEHFYDQSNVNVASLRTLRVLRALKTITILPSLRTIISALIKSLRMLLEVIILSFFCMSVFALFALQIYQGTLRNKCVRNVDWSAINTSQSNYTNINSYYYEWTHEPNHWLHDGNNYLTCGNETGAGNCSISEVNTTCLANIGGNPDFGYTNFDNFVYALLAMFQLITLDFWENQYNFVIRASGSWNILFFIFVVFFGSFYLVNLMLAVVAMSYEEEVTANSKQTERELQRKKKAKNRDYKLKMNAKRKVKATSNTNIAIEDESADINNNTENNKQGDSSTETIEMNKILRKRSLQDPESDEGVEEDEEIMNEDNEEDDQQVDVIIDCDQIDRNCVCCISERPYYSQWVATQNKLYEIVTDPFFELFISFCIFINTVIMACEHYPSTETWDNLQKYSNITFTVVFIIEALMKLFAMSSEYFKVGWNIFDFIVVVASIIDLGVEQIDALSVFRSFRLLRVFKLAQSWQTMKVLLTIIFSTITQMGNLILVVLIVLYMFAVIGLQSFRNTYKESVFGDDKPRWNFDDFWHSMMLVFRIICGEWIEPMWDCSRANGSVCLLLFIPTLVIGNFVVLNLFLALLLNSFASDSLKASANDEDSKFKLVYDRLKKYCLCPARCCPRIEDNEQRDEENDTENGIGDKNIEHDPNVKQHPNHQVSTSPQKSLKPTSTKPAESDSGQGSEIKTNTDTSGAASVVTKSTSLKNTQNKQDSRKSLLSTSTQNSNGVTKKESKMVVIDEHSLQKNDEAGDNNKNGNRASDDDDNEEESDEEETVLQNCCFAVCYTCYQPGKRCDRCYCITCDTTTTYGEKWFNFRNCILRITEHKAFEAIVLLLILISSITLCFEDIYLDDNPNLQFALRILNYIFTGLFFIEMVLKIFSMGLRAYFTSFWTILDFIIVVVSIVDITITLTIKNVNQFGAFKAIRTLRAFKPLRTISRFEGMKIVVNALIYAIPSIFNVLLVCMVFWFIFSITGVQFFKGRFFKCINTTTGERILPTVVANKTQCESFNETVWINSNVNFDNVTHGLLALFQIATFEGWIEIMRDAVDVTNIDEQPKKENQLGYYAFFVIFILVGSFFMLNLFIGVIIDNFNRLKKEYEGNYLDVFLTHSQRKYYNTMKKLSLRKPRKMIRRPKSQFRGFFYDVAMSNKFEITIVVMIFLNMVAMMIEHYKQPQSFIQVLEMINIMFTTIFTLEAIVKLIGLSWHYFRYMWNVFDFFIVLLSIIGIIFDEALKSAFITPTLLRVVRVFRIGRVLRLIKIAKGIRQLLFALIISLPALFNIGTLLFLIMFIYAIIGMTLFGNIKHTSAMNDLVNFENFERTILLLFRLTTAGGWNDVLEPMLIQPPYCNDTHVIRYNGQVKAVYNGNCGIPWLSTLYMTTFIFICYLIIINTYIAIIMENYNQAHDQEEVGITEDDFEMFYQVWERYDPHASQYIKYDYLSDFVAELDQPLGIPKPNVIALVSFDLPIVEGEKIHCLDILLSLVKHEFGDVEDSEEFRTLKKQMEEKYEEIFPTRVHTNVITTTMKRKKEDIAAKTLQRAWRRHKTSRVLRNMSDNTSGLSRRASALVNPQAPNSLTGKEKQIKSPTTTAQSTNTSNRNGGNSTNQNNKNNNNNNNNNTFLTVPRAV